VLARTVALASALAAAAAGAEVGIDVSHHSGEIDWRLVAQEEVDFVYVKASEGVDDADPQFDAHWRRLGELAIPRGAYHFYVTEDDPDAQADFFLSRWRPAPGDLPPVVDVELLGHGTEGPIAPRLRRFLDRVEAAAGVVPILYTSPRFADAHLGAEFGRYPLWVAEYEVEAPTLPAAWSEWLLWQFEGDATVPGIEKSADRSRLHERASLTALRIPAAGRE
jgi:lysozyme